MRRLSEKINTLTRQHAKGYIQLRSTPRQGLSLTTLTFPGLPIPLEISWTVSEGYLVAGATPHAVMAAVEHARGAGPSLLDNASFREMGGDLWEGASYLTFTDIPRLARSGYGLAQLACSAIANGVRSPANPQRDPGLILPRFNELIEGASASVSMYRLDGNDLVGTFQSDRSFLVNLCGGLGVVGQSASSVGMAAVATGVLLPAIGQARQKAQIAKSSAQIRQLAIAMMTYAADNDDAAPPSLEALRPYLGADLPTSPFGPVSDGRGDYWMNTTLQRLSHSKVPHQHVAFYDRAMYEHSHSVVVGFFDGHVKTMSAWELEALISDEPNAGTDFDLPRR
jgi:prepilin-type processing-associated H-X9-DG protein